MRSVSMLKWHLAGIAAAASIVGAPASAWADALPIGPSVGVFTASPEAFGDWRYAVPALTEVFKGLTFSDVGFSMPVAQVTVDGQGPGPVRISFGPDVGGRFDTPEFSLIASDVAFDVGAQALTLDLRVRIYAPPCPEGMVCVALHSVDRTLNDLPVLQAGVITGSIDGAMPLDQAVVLQTLVPQRLELSTDLYANVSALNAAWALLVPGAPGIDDLGAPVLLGRLTVSPVPEVSSSGMLAVGLLGVALMARRRRSPR